MIGSLSIQTDNDFTLLTDCKGGNRYKMSTGEQIVMDCELNDGIRWIVGWNPDQFVGLRDKTDILTTNNYKGKDEDGYVIDCNVYVKKETNEYVMVCVFGEEDGDWGFKLFRVINNSIKLIGGITLTEYVAEQDDYSHAPIDKITLEKGSNGLVINFSKSKYQIWDKVKKEWIVVESVLHYRELNGSIELIE